jgi:hypothetical protein
MKTHKTNFWQQAMEIEDNWESRVRALEAKGCTRSDAQGIVDAEDMRAQGKAHIAGPWEARTLVDGSNEVWSERGMVADVITPTHSTRSGYITVRESEANAQAIAAVPDLIAASLKSFENLRIRSESNKHWSVTDQESFEALQAALTKAGVL